MIARTIKDSVLKAIKTKPVVLITGARQVGKSTLCGEIKKEYGYDYVSLDNLRERETAIKDPEADHKIKGPFVNYDDTNINEFYKGFNEYVIPCHN